MDQKIRENVENTIFVGNLPAEINEKELKKLFRKFGPIASLRFRCAIRKDLKIPRKQAVIKKDFHEESNHINAFIKFQTFESSEQALKMNGELFKGHHLRVTLAEDPGKSDAKRSVFIGNLAFKVQDDDLWQACEDCGPIESVRVVRDVKTGIGKGFGYVNFKSADAVELALKLNGVAVLDRNVRVSRVTSDSVSGKGISRTRAKTKVKAKKEIKKPKKTEGEEGENKEWEKIKAKQEFQGQKCKLSHKKPKKKKRLDKKKMVIKQIAQTMSKKNK